MLTIFFIFSFIEEIIQSYLTILLKETKKPKFFALAIGIAIANSISLAIACYITFFNTVDTNDEFLNMLCTGILFVAEMIILFTSLLYGFKGTKKDYKYIIHAIIMLIIVLLINIVTLFITPSLILRQKGNMVIDYLDKKYGESNYKIVKVCREKSYSGIWSELSGYYYEIKSDYMDDTFIVEVDRYFDYIGVDYFLPVYYSQKYDLKYELSCSDKYQKLDQDFEEFNEYVENIIKEQYQIDYYIRVYDIYWNNRKILNQDKGKAYQSIYYIVPEDNGKIPTIEEVVERLIESYQK